MELKSAREEKGWTQQQAAARLGVTQAYLSMIESGRRAVSARLARRLQRAAGLSATLLPLPETLSAKLTNDDFVDELGALGYPGFAYVRRKPKRNPAEVLMLALDRENLTGRVVEALPWLVFRYYAMDWEWILQQAKARDRQNRLGLLVTLARELADASHVLKVARYLHDVERLVERSQLVREDTLCQESMTNAERNWLKEHRTDEARRWNLLSDLKLTDLSYAEAE